MFGLILWALSDISSAHAMDVGLDPQNRLHLGVNVVDGPAPVGISGGFDSRLTRLVALDIGGFVSPAPIDADYAVGEVGDYSEYLRLRHAIYLAPGIRIPHAQPRTFAYDVFGRVGAGVVWTANLSPDVTGFDTTTYSILPSPAGLAGADALVRVGRFGARISGKAWMYSAVQASPQEQFFMLRGQGSIEGLFQW